MLSTNPSLLNYLKLTGSVQNGPETLYTSGTQSLGLEPCAIKIEPNKADVTNHKTISECVVMIEQPLPLYGGSSIRLSSQYIAQLRVSRRVASHHLELSSI